MMAIVAASVIVRSRKAVEWHDLPVVVAAMAVVPFLQFAAGMLPFSGQAWVCTTYLLGLVLALLIGARWEATTPGRAVDGLFLAVGLAAFASVAMQLRQWLGLDDINDMQVWFAEFSPGRPSANLGQPNQLATLLLWGLGACAWGVARKIIRPIFAFCVALFILFGIVLAQSRIAVVSLLVITLAVWGWRRLWPSRLVTWVVTLLFIYFIACAISLQNLSDLLGVDIQARAVSLGGTSTQLRLMAYRMFLDAVEQRIWWGYGWYQLPVAQLSVAQNHPNMTAFFTHSHNLFLDLVLWQGVLIGGFISVFLLGWVFRCIRRVSSKEDAILALFLLAVGSHAMVELPLHHAYFLLPTGLVMGVLNQRQKNRVILSSGRWSILSLWVVVCIIFSIIIQDYMKIDESFRTYRLEAARIGQLPPGKSPDVIILTDLRAFILNARTEIKPDINEIEFEELRKVTNSFPTPANLFNYAKALAFLHRPAEARAWIEKFQKSQPESLSLYLHALWIEQSRTDASMRAVSWPSTKN